MSKKKPNWLIIYEAMENGQEILFPDGLTYTVIDDTLCIQLKVYKGIGKLPTADAEPDEIKWVECDMSIKQFKLQCEEFAEEDVIGFAFGNAMKDMRNSPFNPSKWKSDEDDS